METGIKKMIIFFVVAIFLLLGGFFYINFFMANQSSENSLDTAKQPQGLTGPDKVFEEKILASKIVPMSAVDQAIEKELFSSKKEPLPVSSGEKVWIKKSFDK